MEKIKKNILFVTLVKIESIEEPGIYTDLMRRFKENGHFVSIVSPFERREKKSTTYKKKNGINYLNIKTLNIQKANIIEKGVGTIAIEYQYLKAIKKYFSEITFDIIIYSTPPITFVKIIDFIKKRDGALSYLLLKDIFPQNAVDMQLIKANSFLYNFFRRKEKKLYKVSDYIGCMSEANKAYILKNNLELEHSKVEVNPNSIYYETKLPNELNKLNLKNRFGIPIDVTIFLYGGNLGKPQGIDFLCETLISFKNNNKIYFIIVGGGTEFDKINVFIKKSKIHNTLILSAVKKEEFDTIISGCDVGLIYLNKNFTIPNFPSRLLSYLENHMPVVAATDSVTDIGEVIESAKSGKKVLSGDLDGMKEAINYYLSNKTNIETDGKNANLLLKDKFDTKHSYNVIINKLENV